MRQSYLTLCAAIAGAAMIVGLAGPAAAQINLPKDAKSTCTVSPDTFAKWFASGQPSKDGAVTAANSVGFPTDNHVCDFYQWGAQMFLWLTSPHGDGLVLDGPAIFTVLPANAHGVRYLVPNTPGQDVYQLALRSEKFDQIGELAQAGSRGVLMSQGGSLVYYGVHVNEVYGYFLTGQKPIPGKPHNPLMDMTKYPRNQGDLNAIENYVGRTFPGVDLNAPESLVMELKTSWVEARSLDDASAFITVEATVPAYAQTSHTTWTRHGTRRTTLALTGMHVVGTVQNHPEFVWASFEHLRNAPNQPYWYTDTGGQTKQVRDPSDADYLFMAKGTQLHETRANLECMKEDDTGNIQAKKNKAGELVCQGGIEPSNTLRLYPWGSPSSQDDAVVENNTRLLSINNSVRSQLVGGDVRANYVQIGGIWTSASSADADAPIPETKGYTDSDLRGSLKLSNATMETYTQGTHCFSCHQQAEGAPNSFVPYGQFHSSLSHIYWQIAPLHAN